MTRIKSNNIQLGDSFVVSIEDLGHKAKIQEALAKEEEIIVNAEQKAAEIIAQANNQAQQLIAQGEQQALSRVEAITQQAHNEGFEAGRQEGYADITKELQDKVIAVNDFAYSNFDIKNNIIKSAHSDIIRLVVEIAQKVCSTALTLDDNVLKELTLQAINSLKDKEDITIIVHPEMAQKIYAISDELKEKIPQLSSIKIIEDASVSPDGTIVESPMSRVDSRVCSQIGEIAERLMGKLDSTQLSEVKPPKAIVINEETANSQQQIANGDEPSCHCEEEQSSEEAIQEENIPNEEVAEVGWASADFGKSERSETRPSEENDTFPSCQESKTAHQDEPAEVVEEIAETVQALPDENAIPAEEISTEIEQEIEAVVEEPMGEDGFVDLADQDIQVRTDDVQG